MSVNRVVVLPDDRRLGTTLQPNTSESKRGPLTGQWVILACNKSLCVNMTSIPLFSHAIGSGREGWFLATQGSTCGVDRPCDCHNLVNVHNRRVLLLYSIADYQCRYPLQVTFWTPLWTLLLIELRIWQEARYKCK